MSLSWGVRWMHSWGSPSVSCSSLSVHCWGHSNLEDSANGMLVLSRLRIPKTPAWPMQWDRWHMSAIQVSPVLSTTTCQCLALVGFQATFQIFRTHPRNTHRYFQANASGLSHTETSFLNLSTCIGSKPCVILRISCIRSLTTCQSLSFQSHLT